MDGYLAASSGQCAESEASGWQRSMDGRSGNFLPSDRPVAPSPYRPIADSCNRCGFPVPSRAVGCKNPCANCGTVYPLGDCSD